MAGLWSVAESSYTLAAQKVSDDTMLSSQKTSICFCISVMIYEVLVLDLTSVSLRSFLPLQSSVTLNASGSFSSRFSCFTLTGGGRGCV